MITFQKPQTAILFILDMCHLGEALDLHLIHKVPRALRAVQFHRALMSQNAAYVFIITT